jgi:hypothetical protein
MYIMLCDNIQINISIFTQFRITPIMWAFLMRKGVKGIFYVIYMINNIITFAISFIVGFGISAVMDTYIHDTYRSGVHYLKNLI